MYFVYVYYEYTTHSLARSRFLSFFSLPFNFILWSAETAKFTILQVLFFFLFFLFFLFFFFFFLLIIIRSGLLVEIWWSFVSKNLIGICVSFITTDVGFYTYHFFAWSNLNFLHYSQWITFPTLLTFSFLAMSRSLLWAEISWTVFVRITFSEWSWGSVSKTYFYSLFPFIRILKKFCCFDRAFLSYSILFWTDLFSTYFRLFSVCNNFFTQQMYCGISII